MIYLDNNATTQPATSVVAAMLPYFTEGYFNASASTAALTGVDKPRREAAAALAKLLNAEEAECFVFTSGATESNNWVLSSLARGCRAGRVLVSAVEHASVAEPAAELARVGIEVVEVPVDGQGVVRLDALRDALREDTSLVSIIAANNETGVLEPVAKIGRLIREHCPAALFHTDATQAVGKIRVDLQDEWQDVDFLSFSAHKFYGPKGIGGLYIRPGLSLEPMLLGGGQEHGLRSGTSNTPSLAGLAIAARLVTTTDLNEIRELRDRFESTIREVLPSVVIHSEGALRLSNTSCFSIPGLIASDVVETLALRGIVVGTGSACSAGAMHPPKTLLAMAVPYDLATAAFRVSLAASTKWPALNTLIEALAEISSRPRRECHPDLATS
jgi:cysteine desulfurase